MGGMPSMSAPAGPYVDLARGTPSYASLAGLANLMASGKLDAGDVPYPLFLMNGRPSADPLSVEVKRGERVRLRLVNAGADTIFAFRVDGHPLTVVASDGQSVEPTKTDAVVVGMGERADVLLEATTPGAHRIVASALGKKADVVGVLRYQGSHASVVPAVTKKLRVASYADLRSTEPSGTPKGARTIRLALGMNMMAGYEWTINGRTYAEADPIRIARNEHVRLVLENHSMMPHPMHLHGNFFRVGNLVKDTVVVPPMQATALHLTGDNPGRWMFHCHNDYHMMSGMMRRLDVGV
jgi:FtsP/CotA-like multicopper oxidase with cupredoxin domain